jgi:hypothetical protein
LILSKFYISRPYFIKCILEDKEPELTSGKDGAKVIEIICAVFNQWKQIVGLIYL